jgi:hypothetical protein
VLFIYITRLASNEIFSPSNKILIIALIILLAALVYIIPTVTNNKETNIHDRITENEIIYDNISLKFLNENLFRQTLQR